MREQSGMSHPLSALVVMGVTSCGKSTIAEAIAEQAGATHIEGDLFHSAESIDKMQWVQQNYDPHLDGLCCHRMLEAARDYISRHGVPAQRKLNLWRKYAGIKTFGKI